MATETIAKPSDDEVLKAWAEEDLRPEDQDALAGLVTEAGSDTSWEDPKVRAVMSEAGQRAVAAARVMADKEQTDRMNETWHANREAHEAPQA